MSVALHISVPAGIVNEVGVEYRELIAANEDTSSQVPDVSQPEIDALAAGALVEDIVSFRTHPDKATAGDVDRLDALYLEMVDAVRARLQRKYRYYGFSKDVD